MSNLPLQSAGLHNDDNDDSINSTYQKLPSMTGRITSFELLKHHQHSETRTANEQACDEIHELQPRNSSKKKMNSENSYSKSSKSLSSHQLMQSNYYDRTRSELDYPSVNHQSEPGQININVEDYKDCKKKYTPPCTNENRSNKDRSTSPPFGYTRESIKQNVTESVGRLLQSNQSEQYQIKTNPKSHEPTTLHCASTVDDHQERSLSPSSSSDCSTDESSSSNKCPEDNEKTNIPYEKLLNDEDEDEEMIEQPTKLATESSTLLNKNLSQTYGTQSTTNERAKYLSNNGYNSHGSSITTKSSSDNSGSIRTNSGSDNDEESDEEHYNNSTASNNPSSTSIYSHRHDSSIKSTNNKKSNDMRHANSIEGNHYSFRRSNPSHPEQIGNKDEPLPQVPRFKQHPGDDPNGNSPPDSNLPPDSSKRSSQQSSTNQTNTSSSSQYNRNYLEQQAQNSTSSRHNSHPQATRKTRKRKQSHQQDIIRTELIPGHRGDRDVDELVMFIDGNSLSLRPTDTNKPRIAPKNNSTSEGNSNKSLSRKKSRKSIKSLSATNDHENEDEQINQSPSEQQNLSTESHLKPNEIHPSKITNGDMSLSNWFEQTRDQSSEKQDTSSPAIINRSNSEIVSEPFVTVTHRRRVVKERRQDQHPIPRPLRFPPPPSNSSDKRRVPSTQQNGMVRPTIPTKSEQSSSSIIKEENHQSDNHPPPSELIPPSTTITTSNVNPIIDQSLEKHQSSPRLSSHSSSSSLSSLLKRQTKPPAVVFLNKSIDFELNDVSFGFDLDSATLDPTSADLHDKPLTIEQEPDNALNTSVSSFNEPSQSTDPSSQKSYRKFPQRNSRGPQFYSGSDIRPQQHRTYQTPPMPQSSYIDPLLLQYNQQRLANYSQPRFANYPQHLTYMNFLPSQYLPTQPQYFYIPNHAYPRNETESGEEPNQTTTDQVQVVYATPTGQIYFPPSTTKKPYTESEPVVTPMLTGYPASYFYPSQVQHVIPSHPPYFQPIPSTPLVIDTKSEPNEIDEVDLEDDYENSRKFSPPKRQQSSADIMSNALQLVYSQQRRNAQTDRFNLDDLTAYLAMKWTDAVDHYTQGDSRIMFMAEQ